VKNKIVVDAELRTVIAKETGFDLLHPPDPTLNHASLKISPAVHCHHEIQLLKTSQECVHQFQKLVHCELLQHFNEHPDKFNMEKTLHQRP